MRGPPGFVRITSGLVLVCTGLTACSVVIDTSATQCDVAADCDARGLSGACVDHVCVEGTQVAATSSIGSAADSTAATSGGAGGSGDGGSAPAGPWSCVGDVTWPEPVKGESAILAVQLEGVGTGSPPPPGMTARVCEQLDVGCTNPLVPDIPVPDSGVIEVELPQGTEAFFELTGGGVKPTLLIFARAVTVESSASTAPLTVVTAAQFDFLVDGSDFAEDPERGTLLSAILDCDGELAAGASISSDDADSQATVFYFNGFSPDPDQTQTDEQGFAGIFNMPPGQAVLSAFIAADERKIADAPLFVRAGWITAIALEPEP